MTDIPAAPGGGLDSRRRELKTRMAAAVTSGDEDTVKEMQKALVDLDTEVAKRDKKQAAQARQAAGESKVDAGRTEPPQGRSSTPPAKATTTTKGTG